MNIQALMKQAQSIQKDMLKAKEEIDSTIFEGKSSFVTVTVNGKKELLKVVIDPSFSFVKEDLEMLEDVLVVAVNDAFRKVDQMTEEKMGKFAHVPGMF